MSIYLVEMYVCDGDSPCVRAVAPIPAFTLHDAKMAMLNLKRGLQANRESDCEYKFFMHNTPNDERRIDVSMRHKSAVASLGWSDFYKVGYIHIIKLSPFVAGAPNEQPRSV